MNEIGMIWSITDLSGVFYGEVYLRLSMLAFLAFNNFIIEHWSQCIFHNSCHFVLPNANFSAILKSGNITLHNLVK